MDNFYASFGVLLIGTKSFYYFMQLSYLACFAFGLYAVRFTQAPVLNYDPSQDLYQCID